MKKQIYILATLTLAISMTSCESVEQTASQQFVQKSPILTLTSAELEVGRKHVTYTYNPPKSVRNGGEETCINVAIQKALEPSDGDVLVETRKAIVTRRGLFKRKISSVTVSGYPAKYKNFKSADSKFIFNTWKESMTSHQKKDQQNPKKKSFWKWATGWFHK